MSTVLVHFLSIFNGALMVGPGFGKARRRKEHVFKSLKVEGILNIVIWRSDGKFGQGR